MGQTGDRHQLDWVTGWQEMMRIQIRAEAVGMERLGEIEELLRKQNQ